MTLKERIKELCKNNDISMNQLEKKLGFGVGYISKLGSTTPNTKKIKSIADYLGVSVDYLMTGKEKTFEEYGEIGTMLGKIAKDTELCKALQQYFELPDARKKQVISIIEAFHENLR